MGEALVRPPAEASTASGIGYESAQPPLGSLFDPLHRRYLAGVFAAGFAKDRRPIPSTSRQESRYAAGHNTASVDHCISSYSAEMSATARRSALAAKH